MPEEKLYSKKTILQVVPALVAGGVERGTVEIAKHIVSLGYVSIVISSGGPLVEQLTREGSVHINLNVASKNPFVMRSNASKIAKIIKDFNVDIIHARSRAPAWSCLWAARKTGIRLITTFHGIYNFKNFIKKYYNSVMTKGSPVIAVSNFVKEHIVKNYNVPEKDIVVIHRGVNCAEFYKNKHSEAKLELIREKYDIPDNTKILLLPSRLTKWKGALFLIEALNKLRDENFYCILAGELSKHPNFVQEVCAKIKSYRLQSKIRIFCNEPNISALYQVADIVLSASIEPEAFGRTIIEAQAMEKIVIATNIGGASETIIHNKTGFHVEPGNVEDLASRIKYCLSILGTEEERLITSKARELVLEHFTQEQMLGKITQVYK
jgi:glycosyltransferase involved in cell wall biosynthesis